MATAALAWQQRVSDLQLKLPLLNMLTTSPYTHNERQTTWLNTFPDGWPEPSITAPQPLPLSCSLSSDGSTN